MNSTATFLDPKLFINRELSWLEFNQRVLEEAIDPTNPLLERLKFFCIVSSNLDEYFEVRVAGLKQQVESGVTTPGIDGMTPAQTLAAIHKRVRRMVSEQDHCWLRILAPGLAREGIRFVQAGELDKKDVAWVEDFFHNQVLPVLTPLAIDPVHPFPQLLNKSLNLIIQVAMKVCGEKLRNLAVVQVPRVLPAVVKLDRPGGGREYVFLSEIIAHFLGALFPGAEILGKWHLRITRNSELYIDEQDSGNLLKAVEDQLHNRRRGDAVRLELEQGCPPGIRKALLGTFRLGEEDLYLMKGPLAPGRLMSIYEGSDWARLRDRPFVAPAAVCRDPEIFKTIRRRDILLHHPYESFDTVIDFLDQSAKDPRVLAMKQTLYRTGGDTRIVGALMQAAANGKQVTAVVELRARFDEANNIQWSRKLEEAGVHVVYGMVDYKIHCKMSLTVREEPGGIRRYVHLSTGNYNPTTARLYTDVGLLTCRGDFAEDAGNLFNFLTGIGQFQPTKKLLVAPFQLHDRMLSLIHRIIAKMNALLDGDITAALYRAAQAGVKIDLIVRGICALRPGLRGISDTITVRSIVDRFLEHSRIFYFQNAGAGREPEILIGSADWMPRNFFRRIETVFPIEDTQLRARIKDELFGICLTDTAKAWSLQPGGKYSRKKASRHSRRSQTQFMNRARRANAIAARAAKPHES